MTAKITQFILNKFTPELKQKRTRSSYVVIPVSSVGPGDLWAEYREPVLLARHSLQTCERGSNLENAAPAVLIYSVPGLS